MDVLAVVLFASCMVLIYWKTSTVGVAACRAAARGASGALPSGVRRHAAAGTQARAHPRAPPLACPQLKGQIDRDTISIDDYTVLLRPLPHDATVQEVWEAGPQPASAAAAAQPLGAGPALASWWRQPAHRAGANACRWKTM